MFVHLQNLQIFHFDPVRKFCNLEQNSFSFQQIGFKGLIHVSGVNPCANVNCKHNEECIINKFGIAACECVSDCEPVVQPVCGSDGLTYDSYCHLLQSSCQLKNNVSLAYNGICGKIIRYVIFNIEITYL